MENIDILNRGITCLLRELGSVDAERFISMVNQEKFDYTAWQREHFEAADFETFYKDALEYTRAHPIPSK